MTEFDAIVVGSGITGGWAAKELTERGLKVLMIERGPMIEHQEGYKTEWKAPWEMQFRGFGDREKYRKEYPVQSSSELAGFNEWTEAHFVNDLENPYQSSPQFNWIRGYQLGGRSLTWGRQCYRWSDLDFGANADDGHGVDWPIRYADIAPWYDHVESFIGVSGSIEHLPQLPDGRFQPPMKMNAAEQLFSSSVSKHYKDRRVIIGRTANITEAVGDRQACQYRGICSRGCSFGAYFSTQSSTLPAARATGNLTILTDSVVDTLEHDPLTGKVTSVRVISTATRQRTVFTSRIVFLCASTVNSLSVMLRSQSEKFPNGLANSSGTLGEYFMDHALAGSVVAKIPGLENHYYTGNRPVGITIPRFRNLDGRRKDLLRGYCFQGMAYRTGWKRAADRPGLGDAMRDANRSPGDWHLFLGGFAECLPVKSNRVLLDPDKVDPLGMRQTRIEFSYSKNDLALLDEAKAEGVDMIQRFGGEVLGTSSDPGPGGTAIHEMGGARMGKDPRNSILNAYNQTHDVDNLFVSDGAAMTSSACQNPSLTYMALTARAASIAVSKLKEHAI